MKKQNTLFVILILLSVGSCLFAMEEVLKEKESLYELRSLSEIASSKVAESFVSQLLNGVMWQSVKNKLLRFC